jgi:hypothetical protein
MAFSLFYLILLTSSILFQVQSQTSDTLKHGEFLSETQNKTLISANGVVEMGFFAPASDGYNYLGIWFVRDEFKKPVWVANRDNPLLSPSGNLTFDSTGNLFMTDAQLTYIVLNSDKLVTSNKTIARLLDSGNFVLLQGDDEVLVWQSFDNPTDTFLPGMRLGWLMPTNGQQVKLHLATWFSPSTPVSGPYTIGIDVASKTKLGVWRKGIQQRILGSWDGQNFQFFLKNASGDQTFKFLTNSTDVLLSYNTSTNYDAVWYRFAANGDINQYTLTKSGITLINYPLCDASAANVSNECVDNVSSNCKAGDEFLMRKGLLQNSKSVSLGPSDCEITCKGNCSCTAYVSSSDGCQLYYGATSDLENIIARGNDTIYTRSGGGNGVGSNLWWIITIAVTMFFIFIVLGYFIWRKFYLKEENTSFLLFKSGRNYNLGASSLDLSKGNDQELPLLSFACIATATDNFSQANKLGEGGFGAVYKGKLSGHEIAVKRLSKCSKQGLEEFKTEIQLISKLQHRNLVKLLGYSVQDEERMLVYEYMPNKSLDTFIFDSKQETPINWEQRLHIINGLAQGLLYLHKYSRLKVIHRDLKTSNILLDSDMTPKIADFGMARIFWDNESMAKTAKIAGTYGYMAPEYAIRGIFSTKSDVFSFGVILLEIVCGRKNTSFGNDDGSVYLLAHAWELWTAGRSEELFDQRVAATYCMKEAVLCIQLGLLCIQDNPDDRPSMSDVIFILSQEETVLPAPKAPALFANLKYSDVDTSRTTSSMNDVTFTTMDGR